VGLFRKKPKEEPQAQEVVGLSPQRGPAEEPSRREPLPFQRITITTPGGQTVHMGPRPYDVQEWVEVEPSFNGSKREDLDADEGCREALDLLTPDRNKYGQPRYPYAAARVEPGGAEHPIVVTVGGMVVGFPRKGRQGVFTRKMNEHGGAFSCLGDFGMDETGTMTLHLDMGMGQSRY